MNRLVGRVPCPSVPEQVLPLPTLVAALPASGIKTVRVASPPLRAASGRSLAEWGPRVLVYTSPLQRCQQAHWGLGELGRVGGVLLSHILLGARTARKWSWEPLGVYDNSGLSPEPTQWLRLQSWSGEEQIP